jgi:hypothetical protein
MRRAKRKSIAIEISTCLNNEEIKKYILTNFNNEGFRIHQIQVNVIRFEDKEK